MIVERGLSTNFPFVSEFEVIEDRFSDLGGPWLEKIRRKSLAIFQNQGLPSRKLEEWKYTDLRPLAEIPFSLGLTVNQLQARALLEPLPVPKGSRIVFNNGHFDSELSDFSHKQEGLYFSSLSQTLKKDPDLVRFHFEKIFASNTGSLASLNLAFAVDGFVIIINENVTVDLPLELVFLGTANKEPFSVHPRSIVVAGPGSAATIVETHISSGEEAFWANPVTHVSIEHSANIKHYKCQGEGERSFHLSTVEAYIDERARYEYFLLALGGRLSRNTIRSDLNGAGAQLDLRGVYLTTGDQHSDISAVVKHKLPKGKSSQKFYGVADGQSHGVFQGKIIVEENAQKTQADQLNRGLLLSPDSEISSKPELEILADDIKCGHGASIGDLDSDAVFYLRSRGISEKSARQMLVVAFINDVLSEMSSSDLNKRFSVFANEWAANCVGFDGR